MLAIAVYLFVGLSVGTVVHEAGHAICGTLVGIPIRIVRIGVGPTVLRVRLYETIVELRLLPLRGLALSFPLLVVRKAPLLTFYFGGILANAGLAFLIALLSSIESFSPKATDWVGSLFLAQLLCIVFALLPNRWSGRASDGLLILGAVRPRAFGATAGGLRYRQRLGRYCVGRTLPPLSPRSVRISYQVERPDSWTNAEVRREIREALTRELARPGRAPAEEMLMLDCLVTLGVATGDPALRPSLDVWSGRALRLGPDVGTLRGSRGAALVELGRVEEGRALLLSALDSASLIDTVFNRLFLSRAALAQGDMTEARRLAVAARQVAGVDFSEVSLAALLSDIEAGLA